MGVSLSHGGGLGMAVAYSEGHPMGVDVEKVEEGRLEAMRSQMTAGELGMLAGWRGEPAGLAALVWTAKEALSKVLRTGMTTPMWVYELEGSRWEAGCLVSGYRWFGQYRAVSWESGGLAFSVVGPGRSEVRGGVGALRASLEAGWLGGGVGSG